MHEFWRGVFDQDLWHAQSAQELCDDLDRMRVSVVRASAASLTMAVRVGRCEATEDELQQDAKVMTDRVMSQAGELAPWRVGQAVVAGTPVSQP
jgi:hypothetical protein